MYPVFTLTMRSQTNLYCKMVIKHVEWLDVWHQRRTTEKCLNLFITISNLCSHYCLTGPGHPVLSWAKCFFCGLPSLSIKVVYSYDFCFVFFNISTKLCFQMKCTVGGPHCRFLDKYFKKCKPVMRFVLLLVNSELCVPQWKMDLYLNSHCV